MIDYRKDLYNALSLVLPTFPEIFVKKASMPCITYRLNNSADLTTFSDGFGYSELSYIIKLWGSSEDDLYTYEAKIDDTMHELGFTRNSANELTYNNQMQLVYVYDAVGYEK